MFVYLHLLKWVFRVKSGAAQLCVYSMYSMYVDNYVNT